MSELDFRKVSYKRKSNKQSANKKLDIINSSPFGGDFDINIASRRIIEAKLEISSTDLYDSLKSSLKEGLSELENPRVHKIVCLGLGKISECLTARYQLVIMLSLSELFNCPLFAYDPVFSENDKTVLSKFNVTVLTDNLEGKYKVNSSETTIFYMPHCPKQLTNNLLWANWGLNLNYCVIFANSFSKIIESNPSRDLVANAGYISKIYPYVLELPVINTFKYYEIFNDLAVHVFPKLKMVCADLWKNSLEPIYKQTDLEFITNC
ncbi:unnamed protein product [Phyllotreta striolata]|uniref:SRR1-like domain-containing protein n=1 Tax=Phyllotreta striolata TaxID=444603 RepID=A0A9N9TIN8_PHYSR|nr:unnamed protein product [Phyllotreta striolata]